MALLLIAGGAMNSVWGIKAYYHILTLPINTTEENNTYHLNDDFNGYRLEALRVMVDKAQTVELPAAYKSPLAKNFKYYYDDGTNVTKAAAIEMYNFSTKNKALRYAIAGAAVETTEKTPITSTKDVHIYVTYDYDATKGIDLGGTEKYNIPISGGFLALNRGRNNRLAIFREDLGIVSAEDLVSEDFVKYEYENDKIPGTNISTYWANGNQNDKAEVAGQFHFLFKFEGSDPYNILIGTAYNKDSTYIESHNGESLLYKWYKGSHLLRPTDDNNFFMASDDHKQYTKVATKTAGKYPKPNPTDPTYDDTKTGYFHNKGASLVYNTFAILNNTDENGYIFMVSRFINDKGDLANPADYRSASYNFLIRDDNYNNLAYASKTLAQASASYSTDKKIYPIRDVTFKVKTPFYSLADEEHKADHIVTAAAKLSQYTIDNDDIDASFIPDELRRKYCTFTTFRNSAGEEITKYADAYNSSTKEYDVYLDYSVAASIPFNAITPKSTYTEAELNAASWYELTDDGSTEENGKKITAYESSGDYKFKNNGASGTFNKNSEYAFIGDPYELRVILRSTTTNTASPLGPHYVGAEGDTPVSGTNFTVGGSATAGYKWEIPDDATTGSFRLRIFSTNNSGTGYWSWDTGNASVAVTYGTNKTVEGKLTSNAQNITLNVSNLATTYGNHLIVEATSGTTTQVGTITIGDILSNGTATITVAIAANSSTDKTFTLTITENNEGGSTVGTATTVTITQGTAAYAGDNVQYNTTATRLKVLNLPSRTYTYKIVDKSGRIAVKASIDQAIFMPLSTTVAQETLESCLPPNIVSPYLVGETLAFYDTYTDGSGRATLVGHEITETPNANHDIFVKYTTLALDAKPINLSEEQEFNVMLNGQYIYYDPSDNSIKSSVTLDKTSRNFFWKLRNRDPYHMLIDNMGARIPLEVADEIEYPDVYDDNGTKTNPERQMGAWVIPELPTSVAAGSTTNVNLSKTAIASISIVVTGLTEGRALSVNASDNNLSSISVSPSTVDATGTATITATLAANGTESAVLSTITLSESGSGSSTTKIILIQDKDGLGFTTSRNSAQQFIAKTGLQGGIYEVMVATGEGVDASTTYYDIGRTSATDIKIYDNSTYAHGNPVLSFILQQSIYYQYHLIDLAKHLLLTQPNQTPDLVLPAEYQSPLVGLENYKYYASDQITINNMGTPDDESDDEYEPIDPAVKLSTLTELDAVSNAAAAPDINPESDEYRNAPASHKLTATDLDDMKSQAKQLTEETDYYFKIGGTEPYTYKKVTVTRAFRGLNIYVTYKANDRVKFNDKASPYMLKFLNPHTEGYYLEDGNDRLIPYVVPATDPKEGRVQAVYPYCNGDGSLNIYGEKMQKEQFNGGASTRPRWIWFFESENHDPYHVMIHSSSTISYGGISHPTYLQTYAVDFVQGATSSKHIVTCGTLPTVGSEDITEYMVLGTNGQFRLKTTNLIDGARRDVTSLEQYWKTYNMIKLHVLGIDPKTNPVYKDKFDNDESTWVVPEELRDDLDARLVALHVGTEQWHSYAIYANATRWNGYNDKSDGHEKKVVERLEHWFQTFDMGDGTFDIESADIPPVLILIDRHGWEIMRKPLPNISTYPKGEAELAALRVYDSPLVDKYYFYSNATKASGCHKYSLRMQNGAERDQIKKNGVHHTSTSLADLPDKDATGVMSNGAIQDFYVTYTVKEEYKDSYTYNFVDHGDGDFTESGTASKFVLVQNGRFYKKENEAADNRKSYITKPIFEYTDPEGGNVYDLIVAPHANNNIDIVTDGKIAPQCLWYIGPNLNIDKEMGIKYATTTGNSGEPWTEYETKKNYFEKDKGGFDPYNIQLKNARTSKFMTSHMSSTRLDEGALVGTYLDTRITLDEEDTSYPDPLVSTGSEGYDHTNIAMTNQTFMAVSDANGNMQLMPRFDHTKRVNVPTTQLIKDDPWPTTLEDPVDYSGEAKVEDNSKMGPQTTFFVRPQRFIYRIIDNDGNEALRYKRAGDYYPTITEHFKSPLATDFKFYYDHATYTTTVSSAAAYTAAATSTYFQKTAASDEVMATAAKALTVVDDYYFKIGESAPFTYKKVTVTKAHSGSDDAVYTTAVCTETDWKNATVHQETGVADLAALQTAVDNLETTGAHYYMIGPFVKDAKSTYIYKKVVVKSGKSDFLADVAAKRDVSDKEITGKALAEFDFDSDECEVFVRYSYNASADQDGDKILQGKWFTIQLNDKDVVASGTIDRNYGTGVSLFTGDKPATADDLKDAHVWHWKFLAAPIDPSSELYVSPDPYAIKLFNRNANYTTNLSLDPNPMAVGIKVNGHDRFSLLRHPSGGYALAVNGLGTELGYNYTYDFLNGAGMDTDDAATTATEVNYQRTIGNYETFDPATYFSELPNGDYYFRIYDNNKNVSYKKFSVTNHTPSTAEGTASTEEEWNNAYHFNIKSGVLSPGTQLVLNNDITHNYTYKVINNGGGDYVVANPGYLAVEATQDNATASSNNFAPYLPEEAQTPLLRNKDDEYEGDYLYYGSATSSDGKYTVVTNTKLFTLHGLYDDIVYVRYKKYDMDNTPFKVPNKRSESSPVARHSDSHDVAMNIEGELPYNIIWESDNMMSTESDETTTITNGGKQALSGLRKHVWYFEGGDPYALKIRHKESTNYVNGTATLVTNAADAMQFMLLKKSGYDYGILQETGGNNKLSGYGETTTSGDPTKFIIFGLSVHDLIYRLIIAGTNTIVPIPYRDGDESTYQTSGSWTETDTIHIYGSTQRDLTSENTGEGTHYPGEKYQLGSTITWGSPSTGHIYSYDAGTVSIGDVLEVPSDFFRPNCTFEFYIQDIYGSDKSTVQTGLNNKYKGLMLKNLMSDSELIDKTVVVNIVYSFNKDLATNNGLDFVRSVDQNLWYTFETQDGSTPYLAHYTNAWGLQSMEGRETRYTNDYLWTPLGDVYGFKMYNRYMIKNSGSDNKVMTFDGTEASEGKNLAVAEPGSTVDTKTYTEGNEIFELVTGDREGYFRVHPVINNSGTQYYVWRDPSALPADHNYAKLSTTPSDWTFGLDMALLEPYYVRAGYVGGLTAEGKTLYEETLAEEPFKIIDLQAVVYDDDNIVDFSKGYYRLHSVPATPGISTIRYASGYLHDIERDQNKDGSESDAIPMHFYSKVGVTGTFDGDLNPLRSGFTETHATRGDIPVPATEDDPSTIFYLDGGIDKDDPADRVNPRVYMSTQGLYVKGKTTGNEGNAGNVVMTADSDDATEFSLIDIGGAVLLITNKLDPATRNYMHYGQEAPMYDLKYYHNAPNNEARWCIEPANNKGLKIATNNGGDDYYYTTFCAPYDVLLPNDVYAYTCDRWDDKNLHPKKVPAKDTYAAGKFVPAGTPVIIRTNDESGSMKLTLPSNAPTAAISSCVFSGKYLEQLLPLDAGTWTNDVYTLGLPFKSNVSKDEDYSTTGDIDAPLPEQSTSDLGFYINATSNKENSPMKARWDKNNRYVIHNKIYYRAGSSGASAPGIVEYVPVIFDDDEDGEEQEEEQPEETQPQPTRVGDGCVYDILGRKVASAEEVKAGTWYRHLSPGVYIVNGQKVFVGVGRM